MDVISLINMKGGSAKSTTTHNLAGALAKLGRRVLAVDNDPQSSLSQGLLGPAVAEALDPAETIAAVYERTATPEAILRGSGVAGVDLLPGIDPHRSPQPPLPRGVALARPGVPPRIPARAGRALRCGADRQPPEPPPLRLGRPGGLHLGPDPGGPRGLREPRPDPRPPLDRAGPGRGQSRPQAARPGAHPGPAPPRHPPALRGHAPRDLRRRGPGRPDPDAADYPEAIAHRLPITHYKPRSAAAKAAMALAEEVLERMSRSAADQHGEAA